MDAILSVILMPLICFVLVSCNGETAFEEFLLDVV